MAEHNIALLSHIDHQVQQQQQQQQQHQQQQQQQQQQLHQQEEVVAVGADGEGEVEGDPDNDDDDHPPISQAMIVAGDIQPITEASESRTDVLLSVFIDLIAVVVLCLFLTGVLFGVMYWLRPLTLGLAKV
jgi:hypothetical protein